MGTDENLFYAEFEGGTCTVVRGSREDAREYTRRGGRNEARTIFRSATEDDLAQFEGMGGTIRFAGGWAKA